MDTIHDRLGQKGGKNITKVLYLLRKHVANIFPLLEKYTCSRYMLYVFEHKKTDLKRLGGPARSVGVKDRLGGLAKTGGIKSRLGL